MKNIQILLMLLGLYASNMAYGVKLPEFDGIYAVVGNNLIEIELGKGKSYNLSPNVQFINQGMDQLRIFRIMYIRNRIKTRYRLDNKLPIVSTDKINKWETTFQTTLKTKRVRVPGNDPEVYLVPSEKMPTGKYEILVVNGGGDAIFYIDEKSINESQSCVDEIVPREDYREYIPCESNSSPNTSGSNTTTSTATDTGTSQTGAAVKPGKTFRDCPDCPEMVILPKSFALGKYEVTQGQWKAIMGNNPSYFKNCGDSCPVEQVSWNDAQAFIGKLNAKTGKQYRLPSEAEWEYACHGGSQTEYCGGNDLDAVGWYGNNGQPGGNSNQTTHPAGQKQANGYGLYDMSGNVFEWMKNKYDNEHDWRVLRGGSWSGTPLNGRAAFRLGLVPADRDLNLGFRLARTLP